MTAILPDPTGFPMIWVDKLNAYMHWLPVSKIQFEHFLCDAPDIHFNAEWYEQLLELNPRVTPRKITAENYWQAFMTGVHPREAQRFAAWCGDGYRLPTTENWTLAYKSLHQQRFRDLGTLGLLKDRESRVSDLLKRVEAASIAAQQRVGYQRTFSDQMLLRLGVLEWVQSEGHLHGWGMKGEPYPKFCGNLEIPMAAEAASVFSPEENRLACAGFRLLYYPQAAEAHQTSSTTVEETVDSEEGL